MRLTRIEVRNFKSIESVELDRLSTFNVLIGRNNVGKSSVFQALEGVAASATGREAPYWARSAPRQEENRAFELTLDFQSNQEEVDQLAGLLTSFGMAAERATRLRNGSFARRIEYHWRSVANPQPPFLQEIYVWTEDQRWAPVLRPDDSPPGAEPTHRMFSLRKLAESAPEGPIKAADLDAEGDLWDSGLTLGTDCRNGSTKAIALPMLSSSDSCWNGSRPRSSSAPTAVAIDEDQQRRPTGCFRMDRT